MKLFFNLKALFAAGLFFLYAEPVFSQACTTLGQTPATAFPVCGTTTFTQTTVPLCTNNQNLFVPQWIGGILAAPPPPLKAKKNPK